MKNAASTMVRVDRHEGPLTVGRFYLVPIVRGRWIGRNVMGISKAVIADWPVIGPLHADVEFFNFATMHYHVDARFLPADDPRIYYTLNYPLHGRSAMYSADGMPEQLPEPVWRRRKCVRAGTDFDPSHTSAIRRMREHYAGRQCGRNASGFVCPHRHAPLGSIKPKDGVIVCPLHGLRIDAITGDVLKGGGKWA